MITITTRLAMKILVLCKKSFSSTAKQIIESYTSNKLAGKNYPKSTSITVRANGMFQSSTISLIHTQSPDKVLQNSISTSNKCLILLSLSDKEDLQRYLTEIKEKIDSFNPEASVILVGVKVPEEEAQITPQQCKFFTKNIKVKEYKEIDTTHFKSICDLFIDVLGIEPLPKPGSCSIM